MTGARSLILIRGVGVGLALAVCGLGAALIFTRPAPAIGYDGSVMLQVAEGLARHGSPVVHHDGVGLNSPYSSYGLGISLIEIPIVIAADHLGRNADQWAMAANAIVLASLLPVIRLLALELGASPRQSVALALIGGFSMPLIAFAAAPLSEVGTALAVTIALLGLAATGNRRSWGPFVAGAGGGMAILMRPDSFLTVLPLLGLGVLLIGRRPLTVLAFGAGLAPFLAVAGWYDWLRFGSPWQPGYANQAVFNHPLLAGIEGFLLSPAKSLFLYVPSVLVAAAGTWWALRRWPVLTAVAVGLLLVRIPFYAAWWAWDGGWTWGPRFLVPGLPGLLVPLLEAVRRLRLQGILWGDTPPTPRRLHVPAWLAVGSVVAASTGVQILGALFPFGPSRLLQAQGRQVAWSGHGSYIEFATSRATEARIDALDNDWRLFPIPDQARNVLGAHGVQGQLFLSEPAILLLAGVTLSGAVIALFLAGRREPR